MEKREKNKNNIRILIAVLFLIVIASGFIAGIIMGKEKKKTENANNNYEVEEPVIIKLEQRLEYGQDITDETFSVSIEEKEIEAKFADLDPAVDTMKIGKTIHKFELEEITFEVTVFVEDTNMPNINGVKDTIEFEFEGEDVDLEKELKKLITAEDIIDGDLDVVFNIEEEEKHRYNVTAEAKDLNDNKTIETFKVVIKILEKEKEQAEKKEEKTSKDTSTAQAEKKPSKPKSEKPKQSKPKQEKPKQNKPKQEKPKKEEPKKESPKEEPNEEYQCGGGVIGIGDPRPVFPPLDDPIGPLPEGASLIKKESQSYHRYSYTKSIPGGGSITETAASYDFCEYSITMLGKDDNGQSFISSYNVERDQVHFTFIGEPPTFNDPDYIYVFYEVGRAFAKAYGMK